MNGAKVRLSGIRSSTSPSASARRYSQRAPVEGGSGNAGPVGRADTQKEDKEGEVAICVAVRIRPLLHQEAGHKDGVRSAARGVSLTDERGQERLFAADVVFDSRLRQGPEKSNAGPLATQQVVFDSLGQKIVKRTAEGFNACLLAYGHSGSGKTHTVLGEHVSRSGWQPGELAPESSVRHFDPRTSTAGLLPRVLEGVFNTLAEDSSCTYYASFYELYNERVQDLLPSPERNTTRKAVQPTVHFHPKFGAFIAGLSEVPCTTFEDTLRLIATGILSRSTATTSLNDRSSRSHAIFSLRIERERTTNTLMMVDLAGREQERLTQAAQRCSERFRELTLINRSLFHLAHCVRTLAAEGSEKASLSVGGTGQYLHLRNSKLTMLLGQCLNGNSHTALLGTISPSKVSHDDSLATLRFCDSVKAVKTRPTANDFNTEDAVKFLEEEVRRLNMELNRAHSGRKAVERHLSEAQAMMEHYKDSYRQALERVDPRRPEVRSSRCSSPLEGVNVASTSTSFPFPQGGGLKLGPVSTSTQGRSLLRSSVISPTSQTRGSFAFGRDQRRPATETDHGDQSYNPVTTQNLSALHTAAGGYVSPPGPTSVSARGEPRRSPSPVVVSSAGEGDAAGGNALCLQDLGGSKLDMGVGGGCGDAKYFGAVTKASGAAGDGSHTLGSFHSADPQEFRFDATRRDYSESVPSLSVGGSLGSDTLTEAASATDRFRCFSHQRHGSGPPKIMQDNDESFEGGSIGSLTADGSGDSPSAGLRRRRASVGKDFSPVSETKESNALSAEQSGWSADKKQLATRSRKDPATGSSTSRGDRRAHLLSALCFIYRLRQNQTRSISQPSTPPASNPSSPSARQNSSGYVDLAERQVEKKHSHIPRLAMRSDSLVDSMGRSSVAKDSLVDNMGRSVPAGNLAIQLAELAPDPGSVSTQPSTEACLHSSTGVPTCPGSVSTQPSTEANLHCSTAVPTSPGCPRRNLASLEDEDSVEVPSTGRNMTRTELIDTIHVLQSQLAELDLMDPSVVSGGGVPCLGRGGISGGLGGGFVDGGQLPSARLVQQYSPSRSAALQHATPFTVISPPHGSSYSQGSPGVGSPRTPATAFAFDAALEAAAASGCAYTPRGIDVASGSVPGYSGFVSPRTSQVGMSPSPVSPGAHYGSSPPSVIRRPSPLLSAATSPTGDGLQPSVMPATGDVSSPVSRKARTSTSDSIKQKLSEAHASVLALNEASTRQGHGSVLGTSTVHAAARPSVSPATPHVSQPYFTAAAVTPTMPAQTMVLTPRQSVLGGGGTSSQQCSSQRMVASASQMSPGTSSARVLRSERYITPGKSNTVKEVNRQPGAEVFGSGGAVSPKTVPPGAQSKSVPASTTFQFAAAAAASAHAKKLQP
eukprot:TRINITY_DN7862_c0_g1_i2.p1 TRINITY_DN7862_c0_g1~~TRINITY_DN7862_c0_g1_i2.p1  ORF type:complete len:1385 (-),score=209.67 TRINITY_DN7862_c0_g1_i2:237-4391(-)